MALSKQKHHTSTVWATTLATTCLVRVIHVPEMNTDMEKNMSTLAQYQSQPLEVYDRPTRLSRGEERRHGRSMVRMERHAEMRTLEADLVAEVGRVKVQAVASVANAAMTAQALVSARQRQLVDAEPSAAFAVAHIANSVTFALGSLVDDTCQRVTR